jgi:hypothetical protein
MVIPFLLIKRHASLVIWTPAIILFLAAICMAIKAVFFPGEGMSDLGERIYVMMFGTAAIGSVIGGWIVRKINKN